MGIFIPDSRTVWCTGSIAKFTLSEPSMFHDFSLAIEEHVADIIPLRDAMGLALQWVVCVWYVLGISNAEHIAFRLFELSRALALSCLDLQFMHLKAFFQRINNGTGDSSVLLELQQCHRRLWT